MAIRVLGRVTLAVSFGLVAGCGGPPAVTTSSPTQASAKTVTKQSGHAAAPSETITGKLPPPPN